MITVVGTNHIFDISKPLKFIIKHIWPDAVLVELDQKRYNTANTENKSGKQLLKENNLEKGPWMYRSITRHQNRTAKYHNSYIGNEMFTAIEIGKFIGAEVGLIDTDIQNLIKDVWTEMSIYEKTRYFFSAVIDFACRRKTTSEQSLESEEGIMTDMRRKYPTIVRKLIDERDEYMANQIKNYAKKFNNIVVVVGDAHVVGIVSLLGNYNIRKIRFRDIVDKRRFNNIQSEIWAGRGENSGG